MTPRPFLLSVDSGNREEPANRYFGTLAAARFAAEQLPQRYWPFVWITEKREDGALIFHMKDGREQGLEKR
jgi:hypothetical protein